MRRGFYRRDTKEKGITLIALVVTIIILLILAGVAIGTIAGDNGLFRKAREATEIHEIGEEKEAIKLAMSSLKIEKARESISSNAPETLIMSDELKSELDKGYPKPISVEDGNNEGDLKVTFDEKRNNRSYNVTQEGNITENKILTPEEAMQIIELAGAINMGCDDEKLYVLTAGGYVIETTITEGSIFDKALATENIIKKRSKKK